MSSPRKSPKKSRENMVEISFDSGDGARSQEEEFFRVMRYVSAGFVILIVIVMIYNIVHYLYHAYVGRVTRRKRCHLAFMSPHDGSIYMHRGGAAFKTMDEAVKACHKLSTTCGAVEKLNETSYVLRKFNPSTGVVYKNTTGKQIKLMKTNKTANYGAKLWTVNEQTSASAYDNTKPFPTLAEAFKYLSNNVTNSCGVVFVNNNYYMATQCAPMPNFNAKLYVPEYKYTSGVPVSNVTYTNTVTNEPAAIALCNGSPSCTGYTKVVNPESGAITGYGIFTDAISAMILKKVDNGSESYFKIQKGYNYVTPVLLTDDQAEASIITANQSTASATELTEAFTNPEVGYSVIGDIMALYGDVKNDISFGTFLDINGIPDGPGAPMIMPKDTTLQAAQDKCDATPTCYGITKDPSGVYMFTGRKGETYPKLGFTSYAKM